MHFQTVEHRSAWDCTEGRAAVEVAKIVKVVITQGNDGNYYAAAFSSNGKEVFRSSEGYTNFTDLRSACLTSWPEAEYEGVN